jgi:hypothetical protein
LVRRLCSPVGWLLSSRLGMGRRCPRRRPRSRGCRRADRELIGRSGLRLWLSVLWVPGRWIWIRLSRHDGRVRIWIRVSGNDGRVSGSGHRPAPSGLPRPAIPQSGCCSTRLRFPASRGLRRSAGRLLSAGNVPPADGLWRAASLSPRCALLSRLRREREPRKPVLAAHPDMQAGEQAMAGAPGQKHSLQTNGKSSPDKSRPSRGAAL